jgi:hypothetical protein
MAKMTTWQMIYPLFKAKNFGEGAYENMQDNFLVSLYRFRVAMDTPMIVNVGYATKGHSRNSYHYQGRAIDFHFRYNPVPTRKIVTTAIKCGLHGIGFYPHWNKPGCHLDNRSAGLFNIWSRNKAGIYTYTFPEKIPESLEEWRKH